MSLHRDTEERAGSDGTCGNQPLELVRDRRPLPLHETCGVENHAGKRQDDAEDRPLLIRPSTARLRLELLLAELRLVHLLPFAFREAMRTGGRLAVEHLHWLSHYVLASILSTRLYRVTLEAAGGPHAAGSPHAEPKGLVSWLWAVGPRVC